MGSQWCVNHRISDEALYQCEDSALVFEYARQRLHDVMAEELSLRAVAQYEYTRLDEQYTRQVVDYSIYTASWPKDLRSYILSNINDYVLRIGGKYWRRKSRLSLVLARVVLWINKRISTRQLIYWLPKYEEIKISDILDGITLQIHYLKQYNLKPQAIIAHPDLLRRLATAVTYFPSALEVTFDRQEQEGCSFWHSSIFGLPVIEERNMKTMSAYVV